MNEVLKCIEERYSCRDYMDTPLTSEQVEMIARAAIQAPSANNQQKWHITMVTNRDLIEEMDKEALAVMQGMEDQALYQRIVGRGGKVFYDVPCIAFISVEIDSGHLDCGIVVENMALAATSLGLGNCICGLAGFSFKGDKAQGFKEKLQFPAGYEFGMALLLGTAKESKMAHEPDNSKISIIK